MTNRARVRALLHYEPCDRVPVVAFGYWNETLEKWAGEGHIARADAEEYAREGDGGEADRRVMAGLGFDFNWNNCFAPDCALRPPFERRVIQEAADGSRVESDETGHIVRVKPGVTSIPSEVGTLLTGREAWQALYLPRLRDCAERDESERLKAARAFSAAHDVPLGLHMGSLYGRVRDMLGVEGLSYLIADDPELHEEIVSTCASLSYAVAERALRTGAAFDYAHYWEDICFNNGPLVSPALFARLAGPHYRRATRLLSGYGIDIVSVDCDGWIDLLAPIWLECGVNTMFPIEVGTWNASIAPWRARYGRALRGVGGMDKRVFARDKAAVDAEIERLKPLVALGGYIPCPDHRIPPDAKYELVAYYCEQFRKTFG